MKASPVVKSNKLWIYLIAVGLHLILIFSITIQIGEKERRKDNMVFKIVDVEELIPPKPKIIPDPQVEVVIQDKTAEEIIETDKEIFEIPDTIEYLPQFKISKAPGIPTDNILNRIEYPTLANKQKIEGVVYLELYIDKEGYIRDIKVLKDPGYGLAEAAVKALEGVRCTPAQANGKSVAVRYRYPVRFQLK